MNDQTSSENQRRLEELAQRSYNTNSFVFTDFLSMAELSDFFEIESRLKYACYKVYGGCDICERKMIRFGNPNELGYEQAFPITSLVIEPLNEKFSDDLNHRDFLGALMNLGIKRQMLGDIFVKDNKACLFCRDTISEYITDNLSRIKHTSVKVRECADVSDITSPVLFNKVIQISSNRLDAIISRVYNLSRNDSLMLFQSGLVYVNGRLCTENAKKVMAKDLISVRGHGRFEFDGELNISKKGKLNCSVSIYR